MENIIQQVDSTTFEFQKYISSDENILLSFPLDTQYNLKENYIEYFIYDENNRLVPSSNYITSNYSVINSDVVLNPELDLSNNYYDRGSYYIQYNFLKNLLKSSFNTPYYITEINSDRTEIRLSSNIISKDDIIDYTNIFIQYRELSSYFVDFYLNFGDNNLVIANNIKLDNNGDDVSVIIKLYEALPIQFDLKQQLTIVEQISTPQTYLVKFASQLDEFIDYEYIKGPNFDIKSSNYGNTLSYIDSNLLTSSNNMYNQLYNIVRNNSLNININYEEFANFVHFSSAEYRLKSFYTKISLLEEYNQEIDNFLSHISDSNIYIQNKQLIENQKNGIIHSFDEYENFLYFNSGSLNSWPKKNNTIPYNLYSVTSSIAQIWWENQIESASNYDQNNQNWLYWSIPEYLRDNSQNKNYEIFLNMIGHHYDNIWIYIDTISNKFNADNRINYGISKNLVADSIQDFGLKLYSNNFSTNDLYTNFIGITENGSLFPFPEITSTLPATSGKEYIDTKISASDDIIPLEDINKRIYKRLYHNIPYLLKTKGTPQGLRALLNIYGVSPNILSIKEYGNKTHYSASYYSTIYDNILTGSNELPDGDTLSNLISIQPKNDNIYLPNYLEIAFSPQDSINDDILTELGEFNIGEYIGDPSHISLKDYPDLKILRENYFTKYLNKYNVNDFIRLIKYFDNSLFKMLKDFIPVKIDSSTGIVIKPHILERNKHNLISASKEDLLYTSSISTETIYSSSGGTGGVFKNDINQYWEKNLNFPYNKVSNTQPYITGYYGESYYGVSYYGNLPNNYQTITISDNREFYNGELPNSYIYTQLNYSLDSASFNQSDNIRTNPNLQDVDYTTNISTPINIQLILSGSASRGTVPESNYTQKSFRIPRYDGSKISSLDINNTDSLTGSFGKSAPVESKKAYFAYIHEIVDPYPLINNKTYFKVKYLIDEQTNINNPLLDRSTYYNLIDTFTNVETIKSSLNIPKQEFQFIRLNNEQSIFRTAQIAVPILYSQTASNGYSSTIPLSASNQNSSLDVINYSEIVTDTLTRNIPNDTTGVFNKVPIIISSSFSPDDNVTNVLTDGVISGDKLNSDYNISWNLKIIAEVPQSIIISLPSIDPLISVEDYHTDPSTIDVVYTIYNYGNGTRPDNGVLLGLNSIPTLSSYSMTIENVISDQTGTIVLTVNGLNPGSRYHIRAFASNIEEGVSYSNYLIHNTLWRDR